MAGQTEDSPGFSVEDVLDHVETYGVDVFPPLDLSMETVRSQAIFAELRQRWPHLFQSATVGAAEFVITSTLRFPAGQEVTLPTFVINPRGLVLTFPRRLSVFRSEVDLQGADPPEVFEAVFDLFQRTFPNRQTLRLGVVRQLVLGTGHADCTLWLGSRLLAFDSGRLVGAQCLLVYQDDDYNYRIKLEPAKVITQTPVAATGRVVSTPDQFALSVSLDVNNRDAHAMTAEERQAVLAKANEFWPAGLLAFLNERRLS